MSERCCPNCHAPLDFQTLVFSMNPIIIRCKHCSESILVSPYIAAILVALMIGVGYGTWLWLAELGFAPNQSLPGVLLTSLALVYGYYEGLRNGIIPSSLIESDMPFQKTAATAASHTQEERNAALDQLIPVIQSQGALANDLPQSKQPLSQPLFGDLVLTYAIDTGTERIPLTPDSAQQHNLDQATPGPELQALAERNARPHLASIQQSERGAVKRLTCDQHMMACGILFPTLWDQIEASEGTEVVIAVPHRDQIWYVPSTNPDAIDELKLAIAHFDMNDRHAISPTLYVREEDEWVEFDE